MKQEKSNLTFWYDFTSAYSFVAFFKLLNLYRSNKFNLDVEFKPFSLGLLFKALGMKQSPAMSSDLKRMYILNDFVKQSKKHLDVEVKFPSKFPINTALSTQLSQYLNENYNLDIQIKYIEQVFLAAFCYGQDISNPTTLSAILDKISLAEDSKSILNKVTTEKTWKVKVQENTNEAKELGIFGAPSFIVNSTNELFWGQDRLDDAIKAALQIKHKL